MSLFRLLTCLCFSAIVAGCEQPPPEDARLTRPLSLGEQAKKSGARKIFTNPGAVGSLQDASLVEIPPAQAAAAMKSPGEWRRLDRRERFDAVVLAGPTSEWQVLASHLLESPDFRLDYADNWGALFVREEPGRYHVPDLSELEKTFPDPLARGRYLSQAALVLDALWERAAATRHMNEALRLLPRDAMVHARAAALEFAHDRHADVLQQTAAALELDSKNLQALELEARAYLALGAADRAWAAAERLKSAAPKDDMNILYLHARIANAVHAYQAEQDSLEKLIALADSLELPATDYRVYLAQCYAKQGLPRPALVQLEQAAQDRTLTDTQRADIEMAIVSARKSAGTVGD